MQKLINSVWIGTTEGELVEGDTYRIPVGSGGWQQQYYQESTQEIVRIITTGSLQSRFSVSEEVTITTGTDEVAKILLSRLFNSKYVDLDFQELTEGVAYTVNYLDSVGALYLDATPSERLNKLLEDGTETEKYTGAL